MAGNNEQNQQAPLEKPPGEGNSQNRQILSKIEPERAPEMMPKHRKSLPNGRQQGGAFGAAPKGAALRAAPFGVLVVFHLVRISYVLASFPEPVLARFSTKFADSENSLPQGACLKSLPATSYSRRFSFFVRGSNFGKFRSPILVKNCISSCRERVEQLRVEKLVRREIFSAFQPLRIVLFNFFVSKLRVSTQSRIVGLPTLPQKNNKHKKL